MRITAITMRRDPIYLSTFTGRPPDEPSVIGAVLNDLALPTMRRQFPEIVDFWLPPEACSYRMAVISIRKAYPGQARRVMMGLWGMLPQFSYTKTVIVVDEDIECREMEGRELGDGDPHGPVARSADSSRHAHRLPRFRFARIGAGRQDGHWTPPTRSAPKPTANGARCSERLPKSTKRVDALYPLIAKNFPAGSRR